VSSKSSLCWVTSASRSEGSKARSPSSGVARETASVAFTRAITLRCVAAKSLITLCSAGGVAATFLLLRTIVENHARYKA
jgi:hypothetical protein